MSRPQKSKTGHDVAQAPGSVKRYIDRCAEAQDHLNRAQVLSQEWEKHRRDAVRQAFEAGATAKDLADALKVSRAKIYQLIGSARALKA